MGRIYFIVVLVFIGHNLFAQVDTNKTHVDTLGFKIAAIKRLSDEDLMNKKEGLYFTGLPQLSQDPITGFGFGAEGELFFNGKKSDPLFAYTPYKAALGIELGYSTKKFLNFTLKADLPYIFKSQWRLRGELGYDNNPNLLYFGIDDSSLNGLSYFPGGDSSKTPVTNGSFRDYNNTLTGPSEFYNRYNKREWVLNVSAERGFLENKARWLVGYEFTDIKTSPFAGNSKIANDHASGKVLGLGHINISFLQTGLVYDTRDLETDPNQGIFAEVTEELSIKSFASSSTFSKTFGQFKFYTRLLPKYCKKFVFAFRAGLGYTAGNAPFYEYADEWSSEGSIEGMGGANTLRGYKEFRFIARCMQFNNIELRYRFWQTNFLKQHFAFSAVPFFDCASVGNTIQRTFSLNHYRYSEGLGLRIAWNVNTILRFDYAISKEDNQFFFNLSQAF